jgi:hypothetical protein
MVQRRKTAGKDGKTEMEYYANFMLKHTPKLYISLSSSKKNKKIQNDDGKGFK